MLQFGLFGTGIICIIASVLMVVVAKPKEGVVVGFLRDKPNLQAWYAMAIMVTFFVGCILIIRGSAE